MWRHHPWKHLFINRHNCWFVNNWELLYQILAFCPQFISITFLWKISWAKTGRDTSTDNSGTWAASIIIVHISSCDQRSYTNLRCFNVALVTDKRMIIVYCIKHCNKYSVNPVRNFYRQKTDFAHITHGYSCIFHSFQWSTIWFSLYTYEYMYSSYNFLDHPKKLRAF